MTVVADESTDRQLAIATHARLVNSGASPLDLGGLYDRCLKQQIWPTQRALAEDLGISTTRVSRCKAATGLPGELLRALRDADVSYKSLIRIMYIVKHTGAAVARNRARQIPQKSTLKDIESILLGAEAPPGTAFGFKITLGPQNKYLRVHTPHMKKIIPKITELEKLLEAFVPTLALFK
jgi:hypothetical protein